MRFNSIPISKIGYTILLTVILTACSTTPVTTPKQTVESFEPEEQQEPLVIEIAETTEPLDIKKAEIDYQEALNAMQEGEQALAERLFNAMTETYPTLSGPYLNLGLLAQRNEQFDTAEVRFRQAILVSPENSIAHNQLGILLRNKGRFKESLEMYQKALELNNDYALAHLNIGILFDLYLGKPAKALNHYRTYQKLTGEQDQQVAFWIADLELRLQPELSQSGGNF